MDKTALSDELDLPRRRFLGAAAMTIAAAQLGMMVVPRTRKPTRPNGAPARDQAGDEYVVRPLKQIDAGLLNVGYAEAGPADGPAVILLHGWPYDIYSFVDVAPLLARPATG